MGEPKKFLVNVVLNKKLLTKIVQNQIFLTIVQVVVKILQAGREAICEPSEQLELR